MPKLTDTQLVILSAAARHKDGHALPVPKSLKARGAALTKTLDALTKKGLLEERAATPDGAAWRQHTDGRRMALVITVMGRKAIDGGPTGTTSQRPVRNQSRSKRTAPAESNQEKPTAMPREGTKLALVTRLLERKTGATIDELIEATDWQAHSVRGAISGTLKKKLGLTVLSETTADRGRVYRISKGGSVSGSVSKGPNS